MTGIRRLRHLNSLAERLEVFISGTAEMLHRPKATDFEFLFDQMIFIRGAAMRLRLHRIVILAKEGERLCFLSSALRNDHLIRENLVAIRETLLQIKQILDLRAAANPQEGAEQASSFAPEI